MKITGKGTSQIGCTMDVPGPRTTYNQRHKFVDIIVIAIMAVICGMDTWNEIEDWDHAKKEWLETFSVIHPKGKLASIKKLYYNFFHTSEVFSAASCLKNGRKHGPKEKTVRKKKGSKTHKEPNEKFHKKHHEKILREQVFEKVCSGLCHAYP